jgi:hypothetical protein
MRTDWRGRGFAAAPGLDRGGLPAAPPPGEPAATAPRPRVQAADEECDGYVSLAFATIAGINIYDIYGGGGMLGAAGHGAMPTNAQLKGPCAGRGLGARLGLSPLRLPRPLCPPARAAPFPLPPARGGARNPGRRPELPVVAGPTLKRPLTLPP